MWADNYIKELNQGRTISFRAIDNSMTPRIISGTLVTVEPSDDIQVGDIVLCGVGKAQYLHLVSARNGDRYQISNNKNHVKGWTSRIYGRVININKFMKPLYC